MAKVMGWTSASWFYIFTPLWLFIVVASACYIIGNKVDDMDN